MKKKAIFALSGMVFGLSFAGVVCAQGSTDSPKYLPQANPITIPGTNQPQEPTTLILRNSYGGIVATTITENMGACMTAGGYAVSAATSKFYEVGAMVFKEELPRDMPTEGMCVNMLETKFLSAKESEAK